MDKTLADTMKLFYIYSALLGACLFAALVWLVVDERKIRRLIQQLEKRKD
jgi:HAMP domain-containing protein